MGSRFTRHRFLKAASAAAVYLGLTGMVGSESPQRSSKARSFGTPKVKPLAGVPFPPPEGVWAFRSRPDLKAPAVEVAKEAGDDTAPGYIFLAPEKGGAGKGGSMIIDDRAQLVWFHPLRGPYGRAMNFQAQIYQGRDVLTWGQTPGVYVIFDSSYREIARFRAGNGYNGDHHEFLISPQDTALITIYNAVPRDLSSVGGSKDGLAWQGIIQELDIETGEVLFEWHSLDHVDVDETYIENYYSPQLDYFHINSIDVDHDDNLIISARNTSAVYKIDRNSGGVMWRLSGKKSDFEMGEGTRTFWQHDARRQPDGTITIFDNGAGPQVHPQSRGIVVDLDEGSMEATLVREYTHPDGWVSTSQGNMQVLPGGNVFIGWGSEPHASEFSREGELLMSAGFPPECESYRAFRLPWKGRPTDVPALIAGRRSSDGVTLHASWNGATEVAAWEVLSGPRPNRLEPLGAVPRDGFETAMLAQTQDPYLAIRARDGSGEIL